jgi:hypothetical protein
LSAGGQKSTKGIATSDELLERLAGYEGLTAPTWLAGHGCEAERGLGDAEVLGLAMPATLRRPQRKP